MKYQEIIKDIMVTKHLSQEQLAKKLKVNQTTVSQWLLGKKKPSYDNIVTLCNMFGVSPNEFFGFDGL